MERITLILRYTMEREIPATANVMERVMGLEPTTLTLAT